MECSTSCRNKYVQEGLIKGVTELSGVLIDTLSEDSPASVIIECKARELINNYSKIVPESLNSSSLEDDELK